jgi:hypothetical protein
MTDPIETELGAFRVATHFEAPDPAVVRRRGDRLRRRHASVKAGGAALALALVATPLLSLGRHGGPAQPPVADRLVAGDALSLGDLPERPELGAWQHRPTTAAALACIPARVVDTLGAVETLQRRYGAHHGDSASQGPYAAQVRETVLAFAGPRSARAASDILTHRLRAGCAASDLANPRPIESRTVPGPGVGRWELYVRTADDVCTECDAVNFDREAVLRVGDRVVLLSLSELGGPLQPKGLRSSMRALTTRAALLAARHASASSSPTSAQSP